MSKRNAYIAVVAFVAIIVIVFIIALQQVNQIPNTNPIPVNNPSTPKQVEDPQSSVPGKYIDYKESELTDDVNILFFAASWCPSCRGLDLDIKSNQSSIPPYVTILKVDYDSSQDLKVKYGVTLQHTIVQVDKNGNLINKWNGLYQLPTLNDVLNLI